jgi:hypothetical protein
MSPEQEKELKEFAMLAAEGRGFLIQLHCPFHLPGKTNARVLMFFGGLELLARWERELNEGKDEQHRREIAAEKENATEVFKTLLDVVKCKLTVEGANKRLERAGKLGKDWLNVTSQIDARLKESLDFRDLLQNLLQFGELGVATLGRQQTAVAQALDSLTTLGTAAIDRGDDYAIAMLVELTKYAVTILEAVTEKNPELVRPFARKSAQWPVLASVEPGWHVHAQKKLRQALELGEDTLHGRLDKSKAYNLENVSRRYARGIVDTLETNRSCAALIPLQAKIIAAKQQKEGIKVLSKAIPNWVIEAIKLEPFSRETAEAWLDVGIQMLKEQCPRLPKSDDWVRITRHWENRGEKQTPGRMWNSIKDALRSPIKTIARAQPPKKVTQIMPPDLGNPNPATNKT